MEIIKYNLDSLYSGFESEAFQNDLQKFAADLKLYDKYVTENCQSYEDFEQKLRKLLSFSEKLQLLVGRLFPFISLTRSADTTNEAANKYLAKIQMMLAEATLTLTKASKYIGKYEYLAELMDQPEFFDFR